MGIRAGCTAITVAAAILAWLPAGEARAANGAYAVDAADISEVGSCKIESWLSTASNTDFSAVANPSCVVNPFKPVELSMLTNRARSDGEWSTTIQPKAKMNIAPTGVGKLGFSFYAGGQAGQSDTPSVVQPRFQTGVRYRPNEIFSVDLIYGRNISGENANWITLGTTIRFPVPGGKPEHHRTGHL